MSIHTFVTSFADLSRFESRDGRKKSFYLQNGSELLSHKYNFVVFVDQEDSVEELKKNLQKDEKIRFVVFDLESLPVRNILKKNIVNVPDGANPQKDTYNYLSLMLSKTYFVQRAIDMNFFGSSHYSWIDFGILYTMKDESNETISKYLKKIEDWNGTERVRIPGCFRNWNDADDKEKFLKLPHPNWLFTGNFFSGNVKNLTIFSELVDQAILLLKEDNFITWEINVWAYLYYKQNSLFDWYYALHDKSTLESF